MSTQKMVLFLVVAVVLLVLALYFLPQASNPSTGGDLSETQASLVEEYVRTNISSLYPESEVLGGKFYVTDVIFSKENPANLETGQYVGRVEYEDGHNALIGEFTFVFDSTGQPKIVSFDIVIDEPQDVAFKEYSSTIFGMTFKYPSYYFLEEKNTGTSQRPRTTIILTEDTEENRLVREDLSPGREGPVAITIDIHQNDIDNLSAEAWVRSSNDSNFKLSNGLLSSVTIAGRQAVSYAWSGLYEADNVVVASNDNLYSLAVTYLTPSDQIRRDFHNLLTSISLPLLDEVNQIQ